MDSQELERTAPAVALIDGDILAYQAAATVEYVLRWDENIHTLHSEYLPALDILTQSLETVRKSLSVEQCWIALSGDGENWRKRVMPTYKAHRKKDRKPLVFAELKNHLRSAYETMDFPILEGDDVLGLLQTSPRNAGKTVIVSIDKDMKTIPGRYCRWDGTNAEWNTITERQADYWHLLQTLTGDTTDGYPGCPGVGPKTAEKLLARMLETSEADLPVAKLWKDVILPTYAKAGLGQEIALENARVARILRYGEYDRDTNEVKLWLPETT